MKVWAGCSTGKEELSYVTVEASLVQRMNSACSYHQHSASTDRKMARSGWLAEMVAADQVTMISSLISMPMAS